MPLSPACRHPAVAVPVECLGRIPWANPVRMDHGNETWTWKLESVVYRTGSRPVVVVVLVWLRARYGWKKWASPDWRTCGHPLKPRDRKEGSHHSSVTEAVELMMEVTVVIGEMGRK